jgi:hypothetical protein
MMHVTCDHCGRSLEAGETHYVVRVEVFAAHEPSGISEADLEADHMEAVGQLLEQIEVGEEIEVAPPTQHLRFDLCPACRKRYVRDPLGKENAQKLHFSEN